MIKGFVEEQYKEFAKKSLDNYLRYFLGFGKLISRIDRYLLKGLLVKIKYNKKKILALQNYIDCEAHRELLITGLKGETGDEGRPR